MYLRSLRQIVEALGGLLADLGFKNLQYFRFEYRGIQTCSDWHSNFPRLVAGENESVGFCPASRCTVSLIDDIRLISSSL